MSNQTRRFFNSSHEACETATTLLTLISITVIMVAFFAQFAIFIYGISTRPSIKTMETTNNTNNLPCLYDEDCPGRRRLPEEPMSIDYVDLGNQEPTDESSNFSSFSKEIQYNNTQHIKGN